MLRNLPLLESFKAEGIEVLIMDEEIDSIVMPMVQDYDKTPIKAVNHTDIDAEIKPEKCQADEGKFAALLAKMKEILKDEVKDVKLSSHLNESTAVIVYDKNDPRNVFERVWWWLPPVIWPEEEREWERCLENMVRLGAWRFVLNASWQTGLFGLADRCVFWAGPMCNTANPLALAELGRMGFAGAFVSPELDEKSLLALPALSPLPLGIVAKGLHPLCVSRIVSGNLREREPFQSPKGEQFWSRKIGRAHV